MKGITGATPAPRGGSGTRLSAPTGNLDSKTAAAVFGLLEGLTRAGKTVVYVTHDRELAARASAAIDLLDGRIVGRRGPGESGRVAS